MSTHINEQYLLFESPLSEYELLWEEIKNLKESHDKTRKRLFKEIKDLQVTVIFQGKQREKLIDEMKIWGKKIA